MRNKIVFLILMLIFTGCTKTVYVSEDTGRIVEYTKPNINEFCAMVKVETTGDSPGIEIWWDKNSDVLYLKTYSIYHYDLTPIMKPDGTCLTYTEWKESKSEKDCTQ